MLVKKAGIGIKNEPRDTGWQKLALVVELVLEHRISKVQQWITLKNMVNEFKNLSKILKSNQRTLMLKNKITTS